MAKGMINPVYDTEEERLKDQLATATALRKQGFSGNTGGGYQGGKVFMVGSPLGNIAAGLAGQYLDSKTREAQGGLEQAKRQRRDEFMAAMPSPTEQIQQEGPMSDGGSMPNVERAVPPRALAQATQQWAANAPPGMESVQQFALQQALTAPEKQAEREAQQQARQYEIAMKAQEQRQSQQERLEAQSQQNALYRRTAEQQNAHLAAILGAKQSGGGDKSDKRIIDTIDDEGRPVKQVVDLSQMKVGDTLGKYTPPTKADAATKKAIVEGNIGIANIDRAIELIREKPNSLGTQYKIPGAEIVGQYLDPEGVPARAAVSNVGSLKLHDRSGAAVTISEFPRLAPFIPTAGDTPAAAEKKLDGLKAEYATIVKEWSTGANTSMLGGKKNSALPAATAPAASAAPAAPATESWIRGPDGKLKRN